MTARVFWLLPALILVTLTVSSRWAWSQNAMPAARGTSPRSAVHTVPHAPTSHPASAQAPSWFPLAPEHEKYLDQVLNYWEHQTSKIKRLRCRFKRWEYDTNWVGDPEVAKTYAIGDVKYAAPDKGLFRVEKSFQVVLPLTPGADPQYTPRDDLLNEHWICDGTSIFEFDGHNKQLVQRELPPEMRGQQIVRGPLPFLFGAKADTIKQRYWIRPLEPPRKDVYRLEAVPKLREDAADAKKLEIFINANDFLPEGIVLYHRNDAKTTFGFEQREVNWNDLIDKLNLFHREFFQPKTPAGWKKVVQKYQDGSAPTTVPFPQQARQPHNTPAR
jgi:TIGR03009 family protein